ncbi:MAG: ABC transporter ATP-binding protein [Candidatus Eremiobacteraeota bacterium]|nr:ABC transporter ATP-binding protein [Candidatus Eremiobacteraeota bacterium]
MAAFLDVRDLRCTYGELEAVHGIAFSVERGSIVALLGANGAGKSTSLRAIAGGVRRSGSIDFDGKPLTGMATEEIARRGIAFVPEGRGTLYSLSVRENLALGAYALDSRRARIRYERVCAYFPWLEERKEQAAGTLSGGEQQMLAIARALMMDPQLMLLDEPSLGLAPRIVHDVFELLQRINREDGMTILLAEQNAGAALRASAHAYVLETGRIALGGPSAALAADDAVRRSYLGY